MLTMTRYGMLDDLEESDTQCRYKGSGGEVVTKQFNYREVLGNQFRYSHQVDDNTNRRHSPYFCGEELGNNILALTVAMLTSSALTEVNANYLWGYLVDGVDAEPQLDFRHWLGLEMAENVLDEEEEAYGAEGRKLRARRVTTSL